MYVKGKGTAPINC